MVVSVTERWLIKGGRLVDPVKGLDGPGDLLIEGGLIANLPSGGSGVAGATEIDARGLTVAPGFIDLHVHFREPGNEEAETVASGSWAAARGGFTAVVTMPNTSPAIDSPELVKRQMDLGRECGCVRIMPAACISRMRGGAEAADLHALALAGAAAFTDDGNTVADENLMREAMRTARAVGKPIMDHALDPVLAGRGVMHQGSVSARLGLPGIPALAEVGIVERNIRLSDETGCAMHIQHVSTAGAAALIRQARERGLPVSGEVTPHHLALCDEDVDAGNPAFKMSPPLGSETDRLALIEAVAEGVLQALSTDHAPHRAEDKNKGFLAAPFGVVGLETAIGVTYEILVRSGRMGLIEWIRRWTEGPALVLGIAPPALSPGSVADVTLLDLEHGWTVRADEFASRSRNTPFEGRSLVGRSVATWCGGRLTWREGDQIRS